MLSVNEMTCVVTGAGGSLGRALVRDLNRAGAKVVAVRHGPPADIMETSAGVYTVKCELSDDAAVHHLIKDITGKLGGTHCLINAAGGYSSGDMVEDTGPDVWRKMLSVNFITTLNCCRAVLPVMKKQGFGRIINFGSVPGEEGLATAAPYAVSKAAVHALTKTIVQEGRANGVMAWVLMPETIDTPANRDAMPDADWSGWVRNETISSLIIELIQKSDPNPAGAVIRLPGTGKSEPPAENESEILSIFADSSAVSVQPEIKREQTPDTPGRVAQDLPTGEIDSAIQPEHSSTPLVDSAKPGEAPSALQPEEIDSDDAAAIESEPPAKAIPDALETPRIDSTDEPETEGETPGGALRSFLRKEDPAEVEDEESDQINPDLASFAMVAHLKMRYQYNKALAMLDILESKQADPDRIREERQEIYDLFYAGRDRESKITEPAGVTGPESKKKTSNRVSDLD